MTVQSTILDNIKTAALGEFDIFTHIAFGDDNTTPSASNTTLNNEVLRKTLEDSIKNTGTGTYLFEMRVALTEADGETIREIGIFNQATGGTMGTHNLTQEVAKTNDKEVVIDVQVTIETENI